MHSCIHVLEFFEFILAGWHDLLLKVPDYPTQAIHKYITTQVVMDKLYYIHEVGFLFGLLLWFMCESIQNCSTVAGTNDSSRNNYFYTFSQAFNLMPKPVLSNYQSSSKILVNRWIVDVDPLCYRNWQRNIVRLSVLLYHGYSVYMLKVECKQTNDKILSYGLANTS